MVGLFGAALIYGDGAITPAISVLSALEGVDMVTSALRRFVLPAAAVILVALFAVQRRGTASVGALFGPVMAVWFAVIGVLGIWGIAQHPAVLAALNPVAGLTYLFSAGLRGLLVLGGVFLCVTGAEALYADMGHFGPRPIRLAWSALVFPSLVLNYAGQTALVLNGAPTADNIFYRLCPPAMLVPLVLLATVATIIASQSIITGAFSMTRQAIQLGWMPRLKITQTSAKGYGQIYVGAVNWLLMVVTLALTLGFGKSDNLAAAYGIAVSATMLMTSVLLFIAMREIWGWGVVAAGGVAGALLVVDSAFVAANLMKVADGGWVPIVLAVLVYGVMYVWHKGTMAVAARLSEAVQPIAAVMEQVARDQVPRVPGTAVFLTQTERDAPPAMLWHLKHSRALHRQVVIVNVQTGSVPWVAEGRRLQVEQIATEVWRVRARFGFMERPDLPALLRQAHEAGCAVDLSDVTYFVGHETVVPSEDRGRLPRWLEAGFAFLQRNSAHVTDYFRLPVDNVVEIGREVAV
jgi:KUP system potassium uptake protein